MKVSRTLVLFAAGVGGLVTLAPLRAQAQEAAATPAAAEMPAAPVRVLLRDVRFVGVTAVDTRALRWLVHDQFGKSLSYEQLQELADRVTRYYRKRSFFLARATLPVQDVSSGVVEIHVSEGRLGKLIVTVKDDAPVSEARVRAMLEPLNHDKAFNNAHYERVMLLLSDLPGVKATSSLEEGTAVGTTDLRVEVGAKRRWQLAVDADNDGTKSTGRERAGLTGRWLSPTGHADNIDLRLLLSDDASLAFGRLAYEAPVGSDGWRAGVGAAHVQYDLGGQYSALDAKGTADVANLFANYPMTRSRNENAFLRLNAEYKSLDDELQAVDLESKKHLYNVSIGTSYESRDAFLGGGYSNHAMGASFGHLTIEDALTRNLDRSVFGRHTAGDFLKMNFQLSRLQYLFPRNNLFVAVAGQFADDNLDPSEQLNIGGAGTVRAFANSELLADNGVVANIEWRIALSSELTLFPYYDYGHGGVVTRVATDDDKARTISGPGLGLTWARVGNFFITTSVAWRGVGEPLSEGSSKEPRWLWQMQKNF